MNAFEIKTALSLISVSYTHLDVYKRQGIKYPIADFEITPDVAIVDPDLVTTMPVKLVAHTGMDAMTHACLLYTSRCV